MVRMVVKFKIANEVTRFGFDGRKFSFPFDLVDARYMGTPRESSETMRSCINVQISRSLVDLWRISGSDVEKVLFETAKEHLGGLLVGTGNVTEEINLAIGTNNRPVNIPYNIGHTQYPPIDFIELEVNTPIGLLKISPN